MLINNYTSLNIPLLKKQTVCFIETNCLQFLGFLKTENSNEKLNSLIIKLPVRSNEEPDWEYMENYMKNIMQDTQSKLDKLACC